MEQKCAASWKQPWFWLMLAGSLLILLVLAGRLFTSMEQQRLYAEYETYQVQLGQAVPPDDSVTGPNAIAEGNASPSASALSPALSDQTISSPAALSPAASADGSVSIIGRIKIPSIHVDLILAEGTDAKELRVGAGHFPGSAMPGKRGNCAIAGHRNYTFGSMFNRLGEMKLGDIITIEQNRQSFSYQVTSISVTDPTDVSVLNQNKHKRELTLITCTPVRIATHRLIIRAELVEPDDSASTALR